MDQITDTSSFALLAGEAAFDPIEERLRMNVRATIEAHALDADLARQDWACPLLCLAEGEGGLGRLVHAQPRR